MLQAESRYIKCLSNKSRIVVLKLTLTTVNFFLPSCQIQIRNANSLWILWSFPLFFIMHYMTDSKKPTTKNQTKSKPTIDWICKTSLPLFKTSNNSANPKPIKSHSQCPLAKASVAGVLQSSQVVGQKQHQEQWRAISCCRAEPFSFLHALHCSESRQPARKGILPWQITC